jgi:hypothetical protein
VVGSLLLCTIQLVPRFLRIDANGIVNMITDLYRR